MIAAAHQAPVREPASQRGAARAAPASVGRALATPGQALGQHDQQRMEARFQHDFGQVRLHTGAAAAASARDVDAHAYTVGRHIVFGAGTYQPGTRAGEALLRHELTHVVQQSSVPESAIEQGVLLGQRDSLAETDAERYAAGAARHVALRDTQPTLRRRWFGAEFIGLFAGENFPDAELQAYLAEIDKTGKIQDYTDSDNKARAVVRAWRAGKPWVVLTTKLKTLLVREMLSGYLSDDDQSEILDLLENCEPADLATIFAPGTVDPVRMEKRFDGAKRERLDALFNARFVGGWAAVQKGTIEPEPPHLTAPFDPAKVGPLLEQTADLVEAEIGKLKDESEIRATVAQRVEASGARLLRAWRAMPPPQRDAVLTALQDEQLKRAVAEANVRREFSDAIDVARADKAHLDQYAPHLFELRRKTQRAAMIAHLLQTALEGWYEGAAAGAPTEKALEAATHPLTRQQTTAARDALQPDVASAPPVPDANPAPPPKPGVKAPPPPPEPPAPKFADRILGEAKTYTAKVTERGPKMVQESWERFGQPRSEARHKDKTQTHGLSEIATISNASAHEVDLVFGQFAKGKPIAPDEFNAKGVITKPGQIHDAWASEQSQSEASKDASGNRPYQMTRARFWLFYLFQNDGEMKRYNYVHHGRPDFDKNANPVNPEAKIIQTVGQSILKDHTQMVHLFEVGRGWDAFAEGHDIMVQLFKDSDPKEDRRFLWDMFFTLIHEYLHTIAHRDYSAYADKRGGEKSPTGNALIEGVDSLLTETVWVSARPRAPLQEVREKVEPDAVKQGLAFDANLLPQMPHRRYDTFDRALKLVDTVGIENLYAAYFFGKVKLIGAP